MNATEALDALPDSIRVAGWDFRIVKWSVNEAHASNRFGEFSSLEQVIRLSSNRASVTGLMDTFFHEICHAFYWVYGIEQDDKEERAVRMLGTALMTLHRDNPWLALWVDRALR